MTVDVPTFARLRDGTEVVLRTVEPKDRARLVELFSRMSPRSVHHRYFALRSIPDLDWIDHLRAADIAVVAVVDDRVVGLGRCIPISFDTAELAFEVGDADQHRGIGTLLLQRLAELARTRGIATFHVDVEHDNADMVDVLVHCGFVLHSNLDRDGYHVSFPIAETDRYARAMAERARTALQATMHADHAARS